MVLYGQIVIGAPGAGKTTYCDGMQQYLKLLGRDCHVVNLDPANEVPPPPESTTRNENSDVEGGGGNDNDVEGGGGINDTTATVGTVRNSQLPYDTILDVCEDVISLNSVMSELNLGPNGGLLYCMEYIEHHLCDVLMLLKERLGISSRTSGAQQNQQQSLASSRAYLLFDLPGQIELTAHSNVISHIAHRLVRELDIRLVCVQLVDASVCLPDVSKFIGAALVCTASMMRIELPCVNVLSKMDLLQQSHQQRTNSGVDGQEMSPKHSDGDEDMDSDGGGYDDIASTSPLPFNLEFFTQCHDLHRLVDYLDTNPMDFVSNGTITDPLFDYMEDPDYRKAQERTRSSKFHRKYHKLHHELCDMVEEFSLLSFLPLSIQDAESVGRVVARVDKCNGYVFLNKGTNNNDSAHVSDGGRNNNNNMQSMFSSAIVADSEWASGVLNDVQEKYLGDVMFKENISELSKHPPRDRIDKNKKDGR
jgi:GTPase SAR1 family protein